jgi:hypothetical protein
MSRRAYIWTGALIGSTVGGMIPLLWGDGMLSGWSILFNGLGGLVGIWIGAWVFD